jgi:hypothetical protein
MPMNNEAKFLIIRGGADGAGTKLAPPGPDSSHLPKQMRAAMIRP